MFFKKFVPSRVQGPREGAEVCDKNEPNFREIPDVPGDLRRFELARMGIKWEWR